MNNATNENQPKLNKKFITSFTVIVFIYAVLLWFAGALSIANIIAFALSIFIAEIFRHYEHLSFQIEFWNVALMILCLISVEFLLGFLVSITALTYLFSSVDFSELPNLHKALLGEPQGSSQPWIVIILMPILVAIKAFSCFLVAFVGGWVKASLGYIEVALAVTLQVLLATLLMMAPSITLLKDNEYSTADTLSALPDLTLFCILHVAVASVGLWLGKRTTMQAKPTHDPGNQNAM